MSLNGTDKRQAVKAAWLAVHGSRDQPAASSLTPVDTHSRDPVPDPRTEIHVSHAMTNGPIGLAIFGSSFSSRHETPHLGEAAPEKGNVLSFLIARSTDYQS